jgi:spermidine synthase
MDVTTIEIDGKVIELAEEYFEIKQEDRFHVHKNDALKFVYDASVKGQIKYDLIIFDINGGA